jgi:hypothetical protein
MAPIKRLKTPVDFEVKNIEIDTSLEVCNLLIDFYFSLNLLIDGGHEKILSANDY